jgi:hypothetical protein
MKTELKTKLEELHELVADTLLERINSGDVTPADLNVARQFLKDNGIDAMPEKASPMFNLALSLPFQDQGKPLEIKGFNVEQAEALPFESKA